jgi:ATP-dependent NAD(P)H-hydrate dehydratase
VICSKSAGIIKAYSPELIVLPILPEGNESKGDIVKDLNEKGLIERIHSFVIGPGLGRDGTMLNAVVDLIEEIKSKKKLLICDGDLLHFVSKCPEIIKGYKNAILTPNASEYTRLMETMLTSEEQEISDDKQMLHLLCEKLGNVTIVKKGAKDLICNGNGNIYVCEEIGSNRRCGGQGDVLAGTIGIFAHWSSLTSRENDKNKQHDPILLACLSSCTVVRHAANLAFRKHYRGTTTPDIITELGAAFQDLFPIGFPMEETK